MASRPVEDATLRETVSRVWQNAGLDRLPRWTQYGRTITHGDYTRVDPAERDSLALAKTTARDLLATDAPPHAPPSLPQQITLPAAELRVDGVLGEGGMGRVFLARQESLRRDVAVKTVRPEIANARLWQSLFDEGVITGALEHPNIIPVHQLGVDAEGRPVLVMKRVEGVAWSDLLENPEHSAWSRLHNAHEDRLGAHLDVLTAVCHALHFAHRHGVVHRDVKPENVMLGEFGEVYLVDWGIACVLSSARDELPQRELGLVGTPGFMAPEMVAEDDALIDARTDVYLLGATLHLVLTGRLRHEGANLMETLFLAAQSTPVHYPDEVPSELARVCNRAMAVDPNERYQTPLELRDALADFLRHRGAVALADASLVRLRELQQMQSHPNVDRLRLRQLLTECRFGFMQSLAQWPGNAHARMGLRDCLVFSVEDELQQGHLETVDTLLLEIESPPERLVQSAHALRTEIAERNARAARDRDRERQFNWRLGAIPRAAIFTGLFSFGLVVWQWVEGGSLKTSLETSHEVMAGGMGLGLMVLTLFTLAARKHLLASRVNDQLVKGVIIAVAAMFYNRLLDIIPSARVGRVMSSDLVVCSAVAAIGGLVLTRWMWAQVPCFALGALAARVWPTYSSLAFAIAGGTAFALGLVISSRPQPAEKPGSQPPS